MPIKSENERRQDLIKGFGGPFFLRELAATNPQFANEMACDKVGG